MLDVVNNERNNVWTALLQVSEQDATILRVLEVIRPSLEMQSVGGK
jgi:hypothetical protein